MSTKQARRSSSTSPTTSSMAKRPAPSSSLENAGKATAPTHLPKKRAPLGDITNRHNKNVNVTLKGSISTGPSSSLKGPSACNNSTSFSGNVLPASLNVKCSFISACKVTTALRGNNAVPSVTITPAIRMDVSPAKSEGETVSMDETMSTCDSFKSPEVEYVDNNDISAIDSVNKKTFTNLYISDHVELAGNVCSQDPYMDMETDDKVVDIADNFEDPHLCSTIACDIYKHLRASESKRRPSTDFMERVQKDINASMRAILIDWLVEVAEEYKLGPDTLYLTVNYIDRYLSGNAMNRQRLQLLGVTCMMIAAKYEEICAPQAEEFCYITDNTYFREEVLEMESSVLNYLKFEMTAPTAKCFLRRFVRVAQGINEVTSMQFECLANYITELSLLEYNMICYAPSLIAASSVFLAKYILIPSKRPWNPTLESYTHYRPSDLHDCVKDLHRLCCGGQNSTLPAIREKYNHHKYKFVAKKYCPPSIPGEFFHNHQLR